MNSLPIVAITMGDAAGISPEIIVKAFASGEINKVSRPLVIGDIRVMSDALKFANENLRVRKIKEVKEAEFRPGVIDVFDLENLAPEDFKMGQVNASCGRAFVEYIRVASRLALRGEVDAVSSAPTNKEAMVAAGYRYPGQTEIFCEETGTKDFYTVLVGGKLKMFLVSSHVSLKQAIELVKKEKILDIIRSANRSMMLDFHVEKPKIGVAGLNPHASDGGLFGTEELDEVIPAVETARSEGIDVEGPYPSDSLIWYAEQGKYDALVAMYHDQAAIPLKKYGYVTYIAGCPIIRTTAGHGTAYDIAGKGIARPDVFIRAVQLACEMAKARQARRTT